ncbi:MAG: tetratricopeptide repeat protein [Bacteroidales bacterium]|nr:tetratricopeptide repeat protein [Bacteroidales bacterium]
MKKVTGNLIFALLLVLVLSSCSSPRSKAVTQIESIESALFSEAGMIDREKVGELIDAYLLFVETYPTDTLAPVYLFKAGDMAMNTNRSVQAIQFYGRIIEEYPDYPKLPEAMFLQGYVYENNLGRVDKAKEIYEKFLELYPENDFADDAEVSLKYLGKSPEELIEIFQQQAAQEAD